MPYGTWGSRRDGKNGEGSLEMKMNQTPSRLSLRPVFTALPGSMSTFLRAAAGGALLALTACSGDLGSGEEGFDGELDDDVAEVDAFETDAPERTDVIEKERFDDSRTFNGFNVACNSTQKTAIREAEARAREILAIALPATGESRVNRTTQKAGVFRTSFVPNASTNPDPNRTAPDEWDTAAFRVVQKLLNVQSVLPSALHTCHGDNESVLRDDGVFKTCAESEASASTSFEGGADNAIRWCEAGLEADVNTRAVTLLHELIHQDRTADARGIPEGRVIDNDSTGRLNNALNYGRWLINNQR